MNTETTSTNASPEPNGEEGDSPAQDKGLLHLGDIFASLESKLQLNEPVPTNTKRPPQSKK